MTAGIPSGTTATPKATANITTAEKCSKPSTASPTGDERNAQDRDEDGDSLSQPVDAPFERRLARFDARERAGELAHRAALAGAAHDEDQVPARDERSAEELVAVGLVDGHGLAGEERFVHVQGLCPAGHTVRRNAITGLEPQSVAGHDRFGGDRRELAVTEGEHPRRAELLQFLECALRAILLEQAEQGVQHEDAENRERFDRGSVRTLVKPRREVEEQREHQEVDERALELPEQALEEARSFWRRKRVRADLREEPGRFG